METVLYSKPEIELPYLISEKYSKSSQEGTIKDKWEVKWAVLTEKVNAFIEELPLSHNDLALADVSRDERGPLTVLTANYGESGRFENYRDDGEISWWSFSNGEFTYHIKRWVDNDPDSIKIFINDCINNYGYTKEEVQVSCSPVAGELRVMCEASFTHSRNDESGDFNEEETDEKGLQESANGVQFSSTINTMEIPADLYLSKEMGLSQINVAKLMELVAEEDAGKVRYLGVLDYGTRIKVAGWYSNEDDNPQQLLKPKYAESETYTKQNVRNCRRLMKDIPEGKYIQFNCSINSTIKKRDKITINDIVDRMEQAGTTTDTISFGGVSINIPKNFAVCKAGRHEFKMKTVWLNQGYNFDCDSIKEKKSPLTNIGQSYWEGNGVQNYTTLSELVYDKITL